MISSTASRRGIAFASAVRSRFCAASCATIPSSFARRPTKTNDNNSRTLHTANPTTVSRPVRRNVLCRLGADSGARGLSSAATAAYDQSVDVFPSIVIGANGSIEPQGSFAEAQAEFLQPDADAVTTLSTNLMKANMGVVAHYYMDVELQGVLTAVREEQNRSAGTSHPRIAIADSLAMGDHAVKMCEDGATSIACLGVDFMSESVATIMTKNGYGHVPVYRLNPNPIGCSLAESAERDSYRAWLEKADSKSLHVVYINTSLETKAVSASIVPTITCTSSNVLNTILQASAQIPDVKIMYGPDTYMGENLVTMLDTILAHGPNADYADDSEPWDDARIARDLHPLHNSESLKRLRDSIDVYPSGNCVVHHMFGSEVVRAVRQNYDDAFVTAHLEVPGEMFEIAMEKSLVGRGTVGSTSDILKFISRKVEEAAEEEGAGGNTSSRRRLRFILGTEAGMVTSIVKSVQDILNQTGNQNVEAEIVFPVSSEAVMGVDEGDTSAASTGLGVVPGVAGGEGCSTAGGCATCPFMKMNDLDALNDIVNMVLRAQSDVEGSGDSTKLKAYHPPNRLQGKKISGIPAVDLGSEPILFMRKFMQEKAMPDKLVKKILCE
eukprot:CAMPEP_0183301918 /NCGR_PEP_ID=MMETSP0160_2-20130417/7882_1 /TAXON_ID=2839 ORGANISM="Odontella Sinensis, Strain Grunow 1884" /NCGR_SAMPLE_ID=MMETSP0160_2 /ASSEMBLY_ACC=CAM_ASM_000250 /LENGTH=609 /DNA_ID=CAMNT_0025464623 /DNA_START=103 /DNA_END=1932 /DNA_ORIENTATION=+